MKFPPKHLPWWWIDRRVYEYFSTNVGPFLGWRNPVLVYQMGKVGSSSMRNSLFRSRDPRTRLVLGSHEFFAVRTRNLDELDFEPQYRDEVRYEIEHDQRIIDQMTPKKRRGRRFREKYYTEKIFNNYVRNGRPARVITMVREPLAANLSMFFEVARHFIGTRDVNSIPTAELIDIFLERYPHIRPIAWFDVELKKMLGIDVFATPFDPAKGHVTISQGPIDLLIMRCDLSDDAIAEAVREFLGLEELEIFRSNVASEKSYASKYREAKQTIRPPEAMLELLYDSKFARHFFSTAEIEEFRRRGGSDSAETVSAPERPLVGKQ